MRRVSQGQLALPLGGAHRFAIGARVQWPDGARDNTDSYLPGGAGTVIEHVWLSLANRPGYAVEVAWSQHPIHIEDRHIREEE